MPDLARDAVDELTNLISAQGRLVRLELFADLKAIARKVGGLAVFVPLILVGHVFAMLALSVALGRVVGLAWALLAVGLVHLVVGGLGAYLGLKRLRAVQALERSREELKKSVERVSTAAAAPPRAIEGSHA
jgi:hypothetical protein